MDEKPNTATVLSNVNPATYTVEGNSILIIENIITLVNKGKVVGTIDLKWDFTNMPGEGHQAALQVLNWICPKPITIPVVYPGEEAPVPTPEPEKLSWFRRFLRWVP